MSASRPAITAEPGAALALRLFGRVTLLRAGQPVSLPGRKHAALLACLALQRAAVPRSRLVAWLWPQAHESAGRASLRQALVALRRAAGEGLLDASGDNLSLAPQVEVDLWRFQDLAAASDAQAWAQALALAHAPLLDGLEPADTELDEAWRAHRQAHAARRAQLWQQCLDATESAAASRSLAEGWLEADPASEPAYRALIAACARLGDKSAGVRAYQRCREALAQAYGVGPSAETEQAYRALLRDAAEVAAHAPAAAFEQAVLVLPIEALPSSLPLSHAHAGPARAGPPTAGERPGAAGLGAHLPPDEARFLALLAAGLSQDITTELTRFRTLAVIASHTADQLAAAPALSAQQAARAAKARYVLSGQLRADAQRCRLSMQLIDGESGVMVWGERYDADRREVLDVTDRIVRAVVAALAIEIDAHVLATVRRRTGDLSAYEHWVQGLSLLKQGSLQADESARACFERALHRDPNFARAYTGLSLSYFNEWSCQYWDRWDLTQQEALKYARQAVELDPADHLALCILGKVELYRRAFDASQAHFERALRLNPNDADNLALIALGLSFLGQSELALELAQAALRLNPRHPAWYWASCYMPLLLLGRHEEAIRAAQAAIGSFVDTHGTLAIAHVHTGRLDEAQGHAHAFVEDFRRMIRPGRHSTPAQAGQWLLEVNPMRDPADLDILRRGLQAVGLL